MKQLFHIHGFVLRCAALIPALALLTGCNDSELRARMDSVETRVDLAETKTKETVAVPPNAAPIRHGLESNDSMLRDWIRFAWKMELPALVHFSAKKGDDGKFDVHGEGEIDSYAAAWLKQHGFQIKPKGDAVRHMALKDFDTLMARLEHECAADPFRQADAKTKPTTAEPVAVFTGQPLDIIVASAPGSAPFYIEGIYEKPAHDANVGKKFLLRGGRFFVDDEGRLKLSDERAWMAKEAFAPAGIDKLVPRDAERMAIASDGRVDVWDAAGHKTELGRVSVVRAAKTVPSNLPGALLPDAGAAPEPIPAGTPALVSGHILQANTASDFENVADVMKGRQVLASLHQCLATARELDASATDSEILPLIVHSPLQVTTEHLKALKIPVEKTSEHTTIGTGSDETDVADALVTVMKGLLRRMAINEENLRNADKRRDADGRLNAYRRKTIAIGPQGNLIEDVDKSELKKNYKPGDPDAGPDGYIVLSNVNKMFESADLMSNIKEYKLLRAALERLAPKHVFPDPPNAPAQ